MKIGLGQISELNEDRLTFIRQLGVSEVILHTIPDIPNAVRWEFMDLLQLRTRCEERGLRVAAIENVPLSFYDQAILGLPKRDEQIENMIYSIRNMGRAGIPVLGYHWSPSRVWRTAVRTPGRGGAEVTSFDLSLVENAPLTHGREYTEEELWSNYEYFLKAVIPEAEAAGVRLALHPDDPPVEKLGGIPRLFRSFEAFKRGTEIIDSPSNGLTFCVGCWSEMGTDVLQAIRYFGQRNKIVYVHFRDVQGTVPRFQECFLGEGNLDMLQVMRTLEEVGFTGVMIPDHVPHMIHDTLWEPKRPNAGGYQGRSHAVGYMQALLHAVMRESGGQGR